MADSKCKICRRTGIKLLLKGERCLSQKCAMVKRPYLPGIRGKRRKPPLSEYGKEWREKQKLRNFYNLGDTQFKNYVKKIMKKRRTIEDVAAALIKALEFRLDNAVFRLGFASSRPQARQLVSHGYFTVNGKAMNLPSFQLKKGDVVAVKTHKQTKAVFKNIKNVLKKYKTPSWLSLNQEKLEGKIISEPTIEEVLPPVEISAVFEFYSR